MRIIASWSGPLWPTAYKDVARTSCTTRELPLDFVIPDPTKCAVVLEALKDEALRVALRAILARFCARRLYSIAGRDEETGYQVEQRNPEVHENG
jgi:hypothetical protein